MEKVTRGSVEIPTALPGFEDDDAREKVLFDGLLDDLDDAAEEDSIDLETPPAKQPKRRWRMLRTVAGFAVFLCILVIGLAWFFGMGWFSKPQAQPVHRSGQRDPQTPHATEDERLKMALSMVASPTAGGTANPNLHVDSGEAIRNSGNSLIETETSNTSPLTVVDQNKRTPIAEGDSYSLPRAAETSTENVRLSNNSQVAAAVVEKSRSPSAPKEGVADDARGRSLFFGIPKKPAREDDLRNPVVPEVAKDELPGSVPPDKIPFGALLPVRLIGSIYTLRNSSEFVRMELTRPVEGNGYSYPAGTRIIGNVRGGQSVRAFVTIVGLIDPASGALVKFSGELLGTDGGSGIQGRRRHLTSQWVRFFRGMKDTAASVLGSVGAIRSGSTVILSEPIRRGTESMTEVLSGAMLKNERDDTFLEVAAGSNGYVLVTGLPKNSTTAASKSTPEAGTE